MILETIFIGLNNFFDYGTITLFGCPFHGNSTKIDKHNSGHCIIPNIIISQPPYHNAHRLSRDIGLGSSPFAHHYKGNHFVFFSLRYLDVSVHAVRPTTIYIQVMVPQVYPRWVAPFGNLRINFYLRIPEAYRSLSRPSSPLRA
jgi:hypothetical protein